MNNILISYILGNKTPYRILKDLDDNSYKVLKIGSQEWTISNWKCTKYADGVTIPNISNSEDWIIDNSGARCAIYNDINTIPVYGYLYNGYTINNIHGFAYLEYNGIQEIGWRVPTHTDFINLSNRYGGDNLAQEALKGTGHKYWYPTNEATNISGLTILPGGYRDLYGDFTGPGFSAFLYSSTEEMGNIYSRIVTHVAFNYELYIKLCGYSVRLVRDI